VRLYRLTYSCRRRNLDWEFSVSWDKIANCGHQLVNSIRVMTEYVGPSVHPKRRKLMPTQIINPPELVPPRGYNHGILASGGRLLFLAGQDASNEEGRIVAPGDLVAQYEQVLSNLDSVVSAAGGSMQDIVKLNIFVRDRDDYVKKLAPLGRVFRAQFGDHYPAMALFEVTGFFQEDALVELEGFAVIE
jgi:enamine deaminase RidA (YjgF/YER057c/UK114 family)